MPKKAVKQHGGVRPNSGRPPVDPEGTTLIGASLPTKLVQQLDAYAAQHEITRAKVVRQAIATFLDGDGTVK